MILIDSCILQSNNGFRPEPSFLTKDQAFPATIEFYWDPPFLKNPTRLRIKNHLQKNFVFEKNHLHKLG